MRLGAARRSHGIACSGYPNPELTRRLPASPQSRPPSPTPTPLQSTSSSSSPWGPRAAGLLSLLDQSWQGCHPGAWVTPAQGLSTGPWHSCLPTSGGRCEAPWRETQGERV